MNKLLVWLPILALMTGCEHNPTVPEVRVVEVKVPVPVKCIDRLPATPELEPVPEGDIVAQTVARAKRERQLIEHANKLKLLASPCTKDIK